MKKVYVIEVRATIGWTIEAENEKEALEIFEIEGTREDERFDEKSARVVEVNDIEDTNAE